MGEASFGRALDLTGLENLLDGCLELVFTQLIREWNPDIRKFLELVHTNNHCRLVKVIDVDSFVFRFKNSRSTKSFIAWMPMRSTLQRVQRRFLIAG